MFTDRSGVYQQCSVCVKQCKRTMWLQSGSLTNPTVIRLQEEEHEQRVSETSSSRDQHQFSQIWLFTPSPNLHDLLSSVKTQKKIFFCPYSESMFTFFKISSLVSRRKKTMREWWFLCVLKHVTCLWWPALTACPELAGVKKRIYSVYSRKTLDYIMLPSALPLTPTDPVHWRSGSEGKCVFAPG